MPHQIRAIFLSIATMILVLHPLRGQPTADNLRTKAQAVLAQLDGKIPLTGLKQPVEVVRDRWGIPHIYAQNADDLFFGQGWVVAQDRLFQLDLWRRVGNGETSEIIGPSALEADRFARLLRFRGDMDKEWASYSPDTKQIAAAFTRGINAYIDHLGDKLPIEFQILGFQPKRWQPEDILSRMSGIIMSRNFAQEVSRARLVSALGIDRARQLAPTDPAIEYAPTAELDLKLITKDILKGYQAASKAIQFAPAQAADKQKDAEEALFAEPSVSASNNWVIDGWLSASGKPMLASDPHRAITVPSLRYLVHLHAPGWNVIGAGEPALPGVALGHNERIAWGITIVGTDQADVFVEKTQPDDPTKYLVGDRWEAMKVVRETVTVKGPFEATVEMRFTRHGPVIHQDAKNHLAFALKWAGSEPGGAAYLGGLAVSRARNRSEFLKALESWKIPSLNFAYADVHGEIGWVAAGAMPIRKPGRHGLLPAPGWTGAYDWEGFLAVKDLPQSFNPRSHWLATANHNILPTAYPHQISYEWAPPHRFLRIKQRLDAKYQFNLEDFESIQHESTSLPGKSLAALLAKVGNHPAKKKLQASIQLLSDWDGVLTRDSAAGALYAVWLQEIGKSFFERTNLDKETIAALKQANHIGQVLGQLEGPGATWFFERPVTNRDAFLLDTLGRAEERTRKLLGDDPAKWRWGKLHTAQFHHPLEKFGPAHAKAFNLGPVERSGDGNTPLNTRHDDKFQQVHGASYRHVFDLADWDRGRATSTPGQSGQLGSPHYGDLLPMWAEAQYFPLAYSRRKVDEVAAHRLTLTPR